MNTGLYLQPSPLRNNDNSLPTAPDEGVDVYSLINELTNRIDQATRKLEQKVDNNALAKILLTDRDITLMGDQVNIVGQVNIVDWIRDVSGNPTGGIDPSSMTRITGGKVQTGVIESFNWSTSAGSQFDLDNGTIVLGGTSSPKFSVNSAGVMTCVDAVVTGTLQAGSIIAGTVTINDAMGPTLGDIASGANVQTALTAGVTNILAGVGTDFRLNVDTTSALITLQHKDAVFLGTAAAGSNKPGLGISSSGIGIGYNRASDGVWVTSITLDASGNAAFAGTISAGSVITSSVTVGGVALSTISSNASSGKSISDALLVSGTSTLKGVLVPTDAGAIKTGTITWNATTGALTGGTGIAVTEWGIIGASAGTATFTLEAATGDATFLGDITGGSNINITGQGQFRGSATVSGLVAAVFANMTGGAKHGVVGAAGTSGIGVYGISNGSSQTAVYGEGQTAASVGVWARNLSTGTALQVTGKMTINNDTLVTNLNAQKWNGFTTGSVTTGSATATFVNTNKPGANSSNSWWVVTDGTTTLRIPCWLT